MTRSTVWVGALFLAAARLCQAQELPEPRPLSIYSLAKDQKRLQLVQQLPDPMPLPKGKELPPLPKDKELLPLPKDKDKEPLPKDKEPLPLPKGKELPPKAEELLPPPAKTAGERPKSPPPILLPSPPYPPPAQAVVDPRTGAWEQMHTPLEVGPEAAGPACGPGPYVGSRLLRVRMAVRHWIYRFNHSGEGASTADMLRNEDFSEWHGVEAKPGH